MYNFPCSINPCQSWLRWNVAFDDKNSFVSCKMVKDLLSSASYRTEIEKGEFSTTGGTQSEHRHSAELCHHSYTLLYFTKYYILIFESITNIFSPIQSLEETEENQVQTK